MTHSFFHKLSFAALAILLLSGVLFVSAQQATTEITGYAWSENIGWISLNCLTGGSSGESVCGASNYKLTFNADDTVTGHAWSEHIGWIKFGGLSSFPTGSGTLFQNAEFRGDDLVGWARACAGTASGDCSSMTSRTDGWDGWIYLGSTTPAGGGVTGTTGGDLSGYAWGSDVVGWIDFGYADAIPPCESTDGYVCTDSTTSKYTSPWCEETTTACTYSCSPVTRQCATSPPPSGCISVEGFGACASNVRIRAGTSAALVWNITNAASCSVSGSNGDGGTGGGAQWNVTTQTDGADSSAINQATVFTLTCTGEDDSTLTDTVIINIIPTFREV